MKLAFLAYNRDPSIPEVDNDGNPVIVRNYSYWLAKYGHTIDIFVNKVIPNNLSNEYTRKKYNLQKKSRLELFPGVKVVRIKTSDLTAKELFKTVELQEIPEITQSVLSASYFKTTLLSDYDLVCIFHPLTAFGVIFRDLLPLNKTLLFPMLLSDEYLKFGSVSPIYIDLEQMVLESVNKIYSTSNDEKKVLVSRNIPQEKIEVIRRGIDINTFPYKQKESIRVRNEINIVTVGSLRPQKRQHILVEVIENLLSRGLKAKLQIVGENKFFTKKEYEDYFNSIKSAILKKDLEDYIVFVGGVEPDQVGELLNSADLAIFPSISESFGKAALESICSGTPTIIASECSAYKEFALDQENAIFSSSNSKDITKAVLNLINNEERYLHLSKNGLKTRKEFSWQNVSKILDTSLLRSTTS